MTTLTKNNILSLIYEQVSTLDLDEMANIENSDWRVVDKNLTTPQEFRKEQFKDPQEIYQKYKVKSLVNTVKILSYDPEIRANSHRASDVKRNFAREDELIEGVAYCYEVRENVVNPNFKLYAFDNYGYLPTTVDDKGETVYRKFKMFIWVIDEEQNTPQALLRNLPRNTFFQTKYQSKDEPQFSSETYTKKYLHYANINKLFTREDIKIHLYKCGLPPIMAYKQFDHPITHKRNDQKYSAPNYNFLLSGIWPASDIQAALDLIVKYRESIALGEDPPEMPPPTHMPRNPKYDIVYPKGNWDFAQKIAGKDKGNDKTDKLRLWMRAIQGGLLSFYIGTDLQIIGSVENGFMTMTATFSSVSENRSPGEEWANYKVEPITPISVHVRLPLPEDVSLNNLGDEDFELMRGGKSTPEFEFLTSMYETLMGNLGEQILEIDPDQAIENYLMFEPQDFESDIYEQVSPPKKILITETQLKRLLKNE